MSATPKEQPSGKLWGGRFDRAPDELFYQFQRSFSFDRRLLPYELAVDRVWAGALESAGILSVEEMRDTLTALDKIADRAENEYAWLGGSPAEDVHHFVETALVEYLGALGYKLHTGRSRNELVATDFRMFVMESVGEMRVAVARLISALVEKAETVFGIPMPGMTHMQHAQPILFSHFLLAHAEAFFRDAVRLDAAEAMADACPMGSGALAGCALDVDRGAIARELGFARPTANSLDAASDRDFALDYLYALAVIATHLSRLSEDFVLFASQEFGFIVLPDEFSTGSSLMPQKKNPDAWELLRGKTGRVTASLNTLLTIMKGLPSSYQRDLQEDKEPVFAAHDQSYAMLTIAAGAVAATRPNEARMREAASDPALLATEAAHYLVRRGAPFRQAHEIVGQIVREGERAGKSFSTLPPETLQKFSPLFAPDFYDALKLESALAGPDVEGGTAPSRVRDAIVAAKTRLAALEKKIMRARTARMSDAAAVHRVIAHYAGEGLLLPRTEAEIREHIARFLVLVEKRGKDEKFLGCVALEPYGADLVEIRSLAVAPDARGEGRNVGDRLMKAAMDTARRRKIARLFAVTHRPEFFSRYGFMPGPRQIVPEKIERDCGTCPKERTCNLIATVAVVCPERDLLPVLTGAGKALSMS